MNGKKHTGFGLQFGERRRADPAFDLLTNIKLMIIIKNITKQMYVLNERYQKLQTICKNERTGR